MTSFPNCKTLIALLLLLATTLASAAETVPDKAAEAAPGHIKLSPEQIKTAGIGLYKTGSASLHETISLYGVITPNTERTQAVSARFPGIIRSVAKKAGDQVREGETLATIESNESLKTYALTAALSGVVTGRYGNAGEQTGDKMLLTISDTSTLWVEVSLFASAADKVHTGQKVRISNPSNHLVTEGEVIHITTASETHNLGARIQIDNPDGRWRPGVYVNSEVILSSAPATLGVRNEAIQEVDGTSVIFVRTTSGFVVRNIKIGRHDSEFSEVLEGVAAGETYAASNSFILKSELGKGDVEE